MKSRLNVLIFSNCRNVFIQETRNYAGHSKWQNIKADKQEHDAARSTLFKSLASKMKVAVTAAGTADPTSNPKLAGLIDQAKKANMPVTTLNNILERLRKPTKQGETHVVPIRCPSGAVLIVHLISDKIVPVKLSIAAIIKKVNAKMGDNTTMNMFDCASYIITSKNCDLNQAMEDAIQADVDDVQEIKDNDSTYFQFKTQFLFPGKASTQLQNLGHSIISVEDTCIPITAVDLNEDQLKAINLLKGRLTKDVPEISKIEDNIAS